MLLWAQHCIPYVFTYDLAHFVVGAANDLAHFAVGAAVDLAHVAAGTALHLQI